MIDILRQKPFFPLANFDDVVKLFEFNLDPRNGEPNLTLLSIVAGLIEHSLVTVADKDDLAANSRPVDHRRDVTKKRFQNAQLNRTPNPSSTSSSLDLNTNDKINNNKHKNKQQLSNRSQYSGDNEAGHVSSSDSERSPTGSVSSPDDGNRANSNDCDNYEEGNNVDDDDDESNPNDNISIPEIEFEIVETLYKKFVDQIKTSVDFKDNEQLGTHLKIKKISDCIWEHLSNSYYKDKAHLQNIFSYLTTSKLDCFGLAFAVIAGCQILNLTDIYLALSEDHAWVMFDLRQDEPKIRKDIELKEYESSSCIPSCALHSTCEVTWHGKANSDKRGQPVIYKNCWLYTNGFAVKCDFRKCVAALVSSINPSINTNTDSEALALLQQRLLWLLYKKKNYFPMSLGNLGELEDICSTPNAPLSPHELFKLGIEISRNEYNDSHVYPYSYLASFFHKHERYKEALETWADSSAVMTKYNYSSNDEEIYKEFFEVANELIPAMLKRDSFKALLQDPECFGLILKLYDNICCWEEGSSTPVLHTTWSDKFVKTVEKFSFVIRSKIKLKTVEEWNQSKANASECEVSSRADQCSSTAHDQPSERNLHNQAGSSAANGGHSTSVTIKQQSGNSRNGSSRDALPFDDAEAGHSKLWTTGKAIKRGISMDDKVDTSEPKHIKLEQGPEASSSPDIGSSAAAASSSGITSMTQREKRLELDSDNNVTVILKSRKIAGMRDLLQAKSLNKMAIELQLSAQSQCVVRGRSNSSSYSSDFISSASSTMRGSTRSKRLQR